MHEVDTCRCVHVVDTCRCVCMRLIHVGVCACG